HFFPAFFYHFPSTPLFLPYYPTRRSSDLPSRPRTRRLRRPEGRRRERRPGIGATAHADHAGRRRPRRRGRDRPGPGHAREDGAEDRKSTRLNSSHVKTSYAVFCMKKKLIK